MKRLLSLCLLLLALPIIPQAIAQKQSKSYQKMCKNIIRPPYLQPGDSVGIMTVSSPMDAATRGEADSLINIVKGWGVKVRLGENLFKHEFTPFSVSDKERAEEFMRMIRNDNLKAIVFYRGGYGAIRTLEYLNFDEIRKHPKWILGFSDVTTYLIVWANLGIETVHGAMLNSFWLKKRPDSTQITDSDALFGRLKSYKIKPHPYNKYGTAEGKLVGGNMTLISIAEGTPYNLKMDEPSVLFIEEVGESLNGIDGCMQQLKKSGKLGRAKAVLVGNFYKVTDKEDPWGVKAQDVIRQYTDALNVPVVFGFPCGHGRPNYATYYGRPVKVKVDSGGAEIIYE